MVKVGLVQMRVTADKNKNNARAADLIKKLAAGGADFVILPEMFNCPYQNELFPDYAEEEGGPTWQLMAETARENGVLLIAGSVPESVGEDIYNTSYVFNSTGEQIAKHRKIHLFDIDIKDGQSFKESDTLCSGKDITVFETPFAKMGLIICYDLRFPELARLLVKEGARFIIVPAAFNMTTGPAHWELLFRTRALDNQVYTIGAAPARDCDSSYVSYGNSIVVNPWGEVIARLGEGEDILLVDLDLSRIDKIRRELPLLKHIRSDIYQLNSCD